MAYSNILIDFLVVPNAEQILKIRESNYNIDLLEFFKVFRTSSNQTELPAFSLGNFSGFISENYKSALELDVNLGNIFTITSINGAPGSGIGSVLITAKYENAIFSIVQNTTTANITIDNAEPVIPFAIDSIVFQEAENPCVNLLVAVTTTVLATHAWYPYEVIENDQNPIVFEVLRGIDIHVLLGNEFDSPISQYVNIPKILNVSNFTLSINNSPNGATLIVDNTNSNGLNLEYSLDNLTWQTSNIFSGLAVDNYVLNIRDQLGCSITKNFQINELGIYSPFFYISKSNSIRFANRITFGDSENYKNDENTLSCEVDVKLPYKQLQLFQSADVITTQFKSNYASNIAKVIKSDGSEIIVPVIKKTNNIGIKDKRDCILYSLGNNKTGIFFQSGNTYNYDTGLDTGTYVLNGSLPIWGVIGNYISIENAWFLIEDIIYDEEKEADIIVFSNNYIGGISLKKVSCIYNIFNYEVYEFTIDMVNYIDQYFRVKFECTDLQFTTITQLSEEIWCKVKHDNVLEIKYRNSTNTDIFYATGITNLIRLEYQSIKGKSDEEEETNKTDTTTILLGSEIYEVDEILFEPMTKELWRKAIQALSHETVTINGVGYVKNGNFDTEGSLEDSNLYVLTATMIKTGSVYNSQGSDNLGFDGSSVEVPGLISTDIGYLSY